MNEERVNYGDATPLNTFSEERPKAMFKSVDIYICMDTKLSRNVVVQRPYVNVSPPSSRLFTH